MEQRPHEELKTRARVRWLRPGDWPILVKTLVGIAAIVVLALSIVTYVNARTLQTELREKIGAEFESLARAQVSHLADVLSEQLTLLHSIALMDQIRVGAVSANARYSGDQAAIEAQLLAMDAQWVAAADDSELVQSIVNPRSNRRTAQLLEHMHAFPDHVEIFVTDRYGGLLAATGRTSDYYQADEGWWQAAYDDGRGAFFVSQPGYDESAGYTALNMAAPIRSESGEVIGIVRTTFRVDAIYQAVSNLQFGKTGRVTVVDPSRLVIADTDLEHLGDYLSSAWGALDMQQMEIHWMELTDEEGSPVLAGHAAIRDAEIAHEDEAAAIQALGWVLFVSQSQAEAYALVTSAIQTGVLTAVAFTLVAIGLTFVVARMMVAPITDLATVARQMAAGDLSARARLRRRDETGELAEAFNSMAAEIARMVGTLEQRIAERTRSLETATEVSRVATSVLDPDVLVRQVVDLVQDRFGLYYVGLFLLDESGQWAVLHAGTGAFGQQMLAQEHRLEVGGDSMIGQCVSRDQARVALDVGEAVRFANPLLPDTRSELALPMRSRGRVIGAITVQSVEEAAFDEAYVAALQTMADQVAVAIDNARLYAEAEASLRALEAAQRRYLGQAWSEYTRGMTVSGYKQTEAETVPLGDEVLPEVRQAVGAQGPAVGGPGRAREIAPSSLVSPITFGDRVVGALGFIEDTEGRQWSADDIAIARAISEQFSLAAENLRLFKQTQRDAARERTVAEVGARVRASLDLEVMLRTAASEIRQALDLDDLVIRLATTEGDPAPQSRSDAPVSQEGVR